MKIRAALLLLAMAVFAATGDAQEVETLDADVLGFPNRASGEKAPPDPNQPDLQAAARQIIDHTNAFRSQRNASSVKTNQSLSEAAQDFADFMAKSGKYGHRADGQRPSDRAVEQGYDYCLVSENIGYAGSTGGYATEEIASRFFTGWKESKHHRENMLDPYVVDIGVAIARSEESGVYFAVQLFGRPQSEQFVFQFFNDTEQELNYALSVEGEDSSQKDFTLPPRSMRTHQRCRPVRFHFTWMESGTRKDVESGASYRVTKEGETFRVRSESLRCRVFAVKGYGSLTEAY